MGDEWNIILAKDIFLTESFETTFCEKEGCAAFGQPCLCSDELIEVGAEAAESSRCVSIKLESSSYCRRVTRTAYEFLSVRYNS